MLASLFSFLNEITVFDAKLRAWNKKVRVCQDAAEEIPLQIKSVKSKVKKTVRFETKPLVYEKVSDMGSGIGFGPGDKKAEFKLKILMTKEEAVRLLSKCKDGGRLELEDVAHELVQIPPNRVSLVSSRDHCLIEDIDHKEL